MDTNNIHKRTGAGGRHSVDGEQRADSHHHQHHHANSTNANGHHYNSNDHTPMLKINTAVSPHYKQNSGSMARWGLSPRREREPQSRFARLLAIIGIQLETESPRRLMKAKYSDANLVQLSRENSLDRDQSLRLFSNLLGLARLFVLVIAGFVFLGMILAKPYNSVKDKLWCSAVKSKKKALADPQGFMTPYEPYSRAFAVMHYAEPSILDHRKGQYMCARAMEFEQIGLLFLTHERIRNEAAWARWFEGARGKIPLGRGRFGRCVHGLSDEDFEDVIGVCGVDPDESNPISNQFLFDVWVHLKKGEDRAIFHNSIFESRLIPDDSRVNATWGGHSLIDATRVLFAASLSNPLVSKMMLVSDSDVPLYGPALVYSQLVSEEKSRVNACNTTEGWDRNEYRLRYDFIEQGITWETWRKSWQWVALERHHASLVVSDTKVDAIFRSLCRARWDHDWCDFRVCYSDEHYIPTLLAIHGLDNETDCTGELTDKDWSRVKSTDAHPWEYRAKEINEVLFTKLRHPELDECERSVLIQSGISAHYITAEALKGMMSRGDLAKARQGTPLDVCKLARDATYNRMPSFVPLGPRCPLLARKFAQDTMDVVESLSGWIFGEE